MWYRRFPHTLSLARTKYEPSRSVGVLRVSEVIHCKGRGRTVRDKHPQQTARVSASVVSHWLIILVFLYQPRTINGITVHGQRIS